MKKGKTYKAPDLPVKSKPKKVQEEMTEKLIGHKKYKGGL